MLKLEAAMALNRRMPALAGLFIALLSFSATGRSVEIGVDEHLGQPVPSDLIFSDEAGKPVRLGDLIHRPTVLALVYYGCPNICGPLMNGMVDVFDRLDEVPSRDYQAICISFDEREKPDLAARKRDNFLKAFRKPFPPEAWRFLTGDADSIRKLTDAVGFRFKRNGENFDHPAVLTILSPSGKITRYLYGIQFLPFDVKLALAEANVGRSAPGIRTMMLYCYSYDPAARRYGFNLLKVTGTLTLLFLGIFALVLFLSSKRPKRSPHA